MRATYLSRTGLATVLLASALPVYAQTADGSQAAGDVSSGANVPTQPQTQTAAGQNGSATPALGDDILVTARRRQERLVDVPLAITAITAQSIEDAGIRDLKSILQQTPGVTLDGNSAEADQVPVIRGQYNLNNAPGSGGQPNVAVFLDGIYIQNSSAISIGLLDLERVEIVKGPVSSLYGRNGFAGAINYISKRPTDTWHATGLGRAGEYGTYTVTGDVNGPIVPGVLRVGLAADIEHSNGAFKDSVTGRRAGGFKKRDVKATFDLDASSRLNIGGGFYYGNDHFGQTPNVYATTNCALGLQVCGKYVANPIEIADIPASSGNSGNTRKVYAGNLRASYDIDFATLNYLGGYNKVTERGYQDFSALRNGLVFNLTPGPGTANVYELFGADDNTRDFSQELRLSSKQTSRFRWAFGGDYFDSKSTTTTLIGLNGAQVPAGQTVGFGQLFVTPDGRPSTTNFTEATTREKTSSAFGSADYDILTNLTLSGEVRYTDDRQHLDIKRNAFIANQEEPFGPIGGIKFHYTNYRVAAKYKLGANTLFYASVATGTKAGGYNGRATISSELSYAPEKNTTYEIGFKTTGFENRAGVDFALYHIDSKSLQINGPSDDPKNVGQVVKNFGGTKNTGLELSSWARPVPGVLLSAGFAYTDPKFTSGTYDFSGASVCSLIPSCAGRVTSVTTAHGPVNAVNLQGLQLERASKYQVNLALDLNHEFDADIRAFGHVDYRYESKQYSGVDDFYYIGERQVVNLRAGVGKGPLDVALVIRNVFNNHTPVFPTQNTQLNNFRNIFVANLPDPRTISGELTFKF